MKIFLQVVRHGQTDLNVDRLISGHVETDLTEKGLEELQQLAKQRELYPQTDLYFVSPLSRAVKTLGILYGDVEAERLPELIEIYFGDYEMKPYDLADEFYDYFLKNDDQTKGDTYASYRSQMEKALWHVITKCQETNKTSATCVGHQGTCRMLHFILTNRDLSTYRKVQFGNGKGFRCVLDVQADHYVVEEMEIIQ